jgi:hypothetical protein
LIDASGRTAGDWAALLGPEVLRFSKPHQAVLPRSRALLERLEKRLKVPTQTLISRLPWGRKRKRQEFLKFPQDFVETLKLLLEAAGDDSAQAARKLVPGIKSWLVREHSPSVAMRPLIEELEAFLGAPDGALSSKLRARQRRVWLKPLAPLPKEALGADRLPMSFCGALRALLSRAKVGLPEIAAAGEPLAGWVRARVVPSERHFTQVVALERRLNAPEGALTSRLREGQRHRARWALELQGVPLSPDGLPVSFHQALKALLLAQGGALAGVSKQLGHSWKRWLSGRPRLLMSSFGTVRRLDELLKSPHGALAARFKRELAQPVVLGRRRHAPTLNGPIEPKDQLPKDFHEALNVLVYRSPLSQIQINRRAGTAWQGWRRGKIPTARGIRPLKVLERVLGAAPGTLSSRLSLKVARGPLSASLARTQAAALDLKARRHAQANTRRARAAHALTAFGRLLSRARLKRKISALKLCARVGLKVPSWYKWASGAAAPRPDADPTLKKLEKHLKLKAGTLVKRAALARAGL